MKVSFCGAVSDEESRSWLITLNQRFLAELTLSHLLRFFASLRMTAKDSE